jgi:hypothetical protein
MSLPDFAPLHPGYVPLNVVSCPASSDLKAPEFLDVRQQLPPDLFLFGIGKSGDLRHRSLEGLYHFPPPKERRQRHSTFTTS